jgi:hypothetical protein
VNICNLYFADLDDDPEIEDNEYIGSLFIEYNSTLKTQAPSFSPTSFYGCFICQQNFYTESMFIRHFEVIHGGVNFNFLTSVNMKQDW